jgi:hypothetical protein
VCSRSTHRSFPRRRRARSPDRCEPREGAVGAGSHPARRAARCLRPSRLALLRLDAVGDGILALFLLAATWDDLYRWLGLPRAEPAWFAQLLGAALLAVALAEWSTAGRPGQREVSRAVAAGNVIAAIVLSVWLLSGDSGADTHGQVLLWTIAASLALEAGLHARAR